MAKGQGFGVQALTPGPQRPGVIAPAAVEWVPNNGVADGGQMYPYLVGPAGLNLHPQPGVPVKGFNKAPMSHGVAAALGEKGHLLAVFGVAADIAYHTAIPTIRHPVDIGLIDLFNLSILELRDQTMKRQITLGGHQDPRGILIKTVDNSRTQGPIDAAQIPAVKEEGVYQGAPPVAAGGMYHQTRGFQEHHDITIFIEDLKWYIFRD